MKLRIISLSIAIFFSLSTVSALFWSNVDKIRWDKVPILNLFILQIELAPMAFDASHLTEPITWDQLDNEPKGWNEEENGPWFCLNAYTKNMLKNYMKENNLGIVPSYWQDFRLVSNFEECLEIFKFVSLGEPEPKPKENFFENNIASIILGSLSIICWGIFISTFKK